MGDNDGESVPPSRESTGEEGAAHLGDEARSAVQAHASPEGIVTILFTDIVESTRLRQRLGDSAAQERFRQHNHVVRAQIEKHGGFEVKTQGDGFMIAFSDVAAALECAVAIQRAIADDNLQHPTEKIEVRIGLNCGQAIKEEEDFFGGAVIVAARLGALAKGGQIFVSEAVRVLAGLPEGIGYVRRGRRKLKGLEGSYDVWSVPWREGEARGFAKLWAKPAVRVLAPAVLLLAIGGGVAGGLVLGLGGGGELSPPAPVVQELAIHFLIEENELLEEGEEVAVCESEDLVIAGPFEGEVTGDVSGRLTGRAEVITYAVDACQSGFIRATFTITDANENTLSGVFEGPISIIRLLGEGGEGASAGLGSALVITISGGTGIYEGATGGGACSAVLAVRLDRGTFYSRAEGDCRGELTTGGPPPVVPEPLIVQLAASPLEVMVSGGSFDPRSTVALAVLYGNTRDEAQRGLSLRLPVPEGAEIVAWALGEAQTASAGERIWSLPDLPPGELQRFEFSIQFLAAETPTVPLVVEIEGEEFERPVPSDPIMIQVVQ